MASYFIYILLLASLSVAITTTTTTTTTTVTMTPTTGVAAPSQETKRAEAARNTTDSRKTLGVYFTNWGIYDANYQPSDLSADQITHILYAFADIAPDGEVKSSDPWADTGKRYDGDSWNNSSHDVYGCVKQLNLIKQKNRHLKVVLSIGGWSYSHKFALPASTDAGRRRFASSAVKLITDWGFDGLDIDWEYPKDPQEAHNYVLLLQACREALDDYAADYAPDYHFLLTVASPAAPEKVGVMDLAGMDDQLDAWNLMAYDYAGAWDSTSGHQAALFPSEDNPESTKFDTETAVNAYVKQGISPLKIILGVPLYGRSFSGTDGLGMPYNDVGTSPSGTWPYNDLPRPGASEYFDNTTASTYSYDPDNRELVSYDDSKSAGMKAQWILQTGLGGAFFWEASGDSSGNSSLVGIFKSSFDSVDWSTNLISYPLSQYDNIRGRMED